MTDLHAVCDHGSLRRKCNICERDDQIKQLVDYIACEIYAQLRPHGSAWWALAEEQRDHWRKAAREDVEAWAASQPHPGGDGGR